MSKQAYIVINRERKKQHLWCEDITSVLNASRALVKYRGHDADKIFILKMDLANAIAEYDSKPNSL